MTPFEIPLTFRRADFEAIYFSGGHDRIFTNPHTRRLAFTTIMVAIAWAAVLFYTVSAHQSQLIFFALTGVLAITIARLRKRAVPILRWKKEITAFFDKLDGYTQHRLLITNDDFTLTQDAETSTEKWSAVRKTEITDTYISIVASSDYLFPRTSMSESDFQQLLKVVQEKTIV